jgi:cytochrome c oxidase subunit 3
MATADAHNEHDDHHHDHGEFIAHHFDGGAEQQFDSGKLGIWLFLVTEVLFFSGLFVAYTLYRNHHPEIFDQAHVFLDKYLGGLNTIVLLFSSLTMALAVRAAQLGRNKNCGTYILITMVCAAMFLGVKAVEYSHKWDMGILVTSGFDLTYDAPKLMNVGGIELSKYLVWLSAVPAVLLVGFVVASIVGLLTARPNMSKFMLGLAVTVGGYFLGAAVGHIYMEAKHAAEHDAAHAAIISPMADSIQPVALLLEDDEHKEGDHTGEEHKAGEHGEGEHADGHGASDGHDHADHGPMVYDAHHPDPEKLSRDVGIFFSIYYCMTGLHAIHIIAGIAALAWVYWRCILGHWRTDYFGPVDYVGLYWHLVDLIWIYLFPLLYLID